MKRKEFKQVVKAFSSWRIDRRSGDYRLPNGERLSAYLIRQAAKICRLFNIAIGSDGNIYDIIDNKIFKPFDIDEALDYTEQYERICHLIKEMVG